MWKAIHKLPVWRFVPGFIITAILIACLFASLHRPFQTPTNTPTPTPAEHDEQEAVEHLNRGINHQEQGQQDLAIADFDRAIELEPGLAEAYGNRGRAYAEMGDYDRAIADLNRTIELQPDLAEAYFNRGVAYWHKGDYDRAIADYDRAIELKPGLAEAYGNRGRVYAEMGDFDRAISDLDRAIADHQVDGKICVVNEPGEIKSSYNRLVADGVNRASEEYRVETVTLDATLQEELVSNINTFVTAGDCDLIIGVGSAVGFAMEPFVVANSEQKFTVVDAPDFGDNGGYPNLVGITFKEDQAGFMVGYVGAWVSTTTTGTGKVGTFGGLPSLSSVTDFMDGFWMGVDYYNTQHRAEVEVLGWDPCSQEGLFTSTFDDPGAGQEFTAQLYDQGASIVFPVAGATGFGAFDLASDLKASGESPNLYVIGVDTDWSEILDDPERVILTSALKRLDVAVFDHIGLVLRGEWNEAADYQGSLANGGVGYAPLHHDIDLVDGLINELLGIREGIIDESIPTRPFCE
jgi:basic membrane protein A